MRPIQTKLLVGGALVASLAVSVAALAADQGDRTSAAPTEADVVKYQLQERCSSDAAAFFERQKKLDAENESVFVATKGNNTYDYENNYSESKEGCFILMRGSEMETSKSDAQHPDGDLSIMTTYELFNVVTHHSVGSYSNWSHDGKNQFIRDTCEFDGVKCSSAAEWWAKLAPYIPAARQDG